eukprot:8490021-Heterocapsa_arctica.AAC.1
MVPALETRSGAYFFPQFLPLFWCPAIRPAACPYYGQLPLRYAFPSSAIRPRVVFSLFPLRFPAM